MAAVVGQEEIHVRWTLREKIQAAGRQKNSAEVTAYAAKLKGLGDFEADDMRAIATAAGQSRCDLEQVCRRTFMAAAANENIAAYYCRELADAGALKDALTITQKWGHRALERELWLRTPEGQLHLAREAARRGEHREVINALFPSGRYVESALPPFERPADRVESIRLSSDAMLNLSEWRDGVCNLLAERERHEPCPESVVSRAISRLGSPTQQQLALLNRWAQRLPRNGALQLARARCALSQGADQTCVESGQAALELGEREVECRRLLWQALQRQGHHSEALTQLSHLSTLRNPLTDEAVARAACLVALVPRALQEGRGDLDVSPGAGHYFGRAIEAMKVLGGGRTTNVPYSKRVFEAAPTPVDPRALQGEFEALSKKMQGFGRIIADTVAAGTQTSLQGLGVLAAIDPTVLDALRFSYADGPSTVNRIGEHLNWSTAGAEGGMNRLAGYAYEQQVAARLASEGHVVSFPTEANNPGFDLLVDGHPLQIKLSSSADYVFDHLARYPDLPVVVPSDLAATFADHPHVFVDHTTTVAEVKAGVAETVAAVDSIGAIGVADIPWITIGISAVRNYGHYSQGRMTQEKYLLRVGEDGLYVGGGMVVGKLIAIGVGSLFFGPFGVVVCGLLGAMSGSAAMRGRLDAKRFPEVCAYRDEVVTALGDLGHRFSEFARKRAVAAEVKLKSVSAWADGARVRREGSYVDDLEAIALECANRYRRVSNWCDQQQGETGQCVRGMYALVHSVSCIDPKVRTLAHIAAAALEQYNAASALAV